jgi:hypothetical protein
MESTMSKAPRIQTSQNCIGEWEAIDDRTYDGPGAQMGVGHTEQEAIDNLKDQLVEDGLYPDEMEG